MSSQGLPRLECDWKRNCQGLCWKGRLWRAERIWKVSSHGELGYISEYLDCNLYRGGILIPVSRKDLGEDGSVPCGHRPQ